jgi:L-ascorbate metabolism protein UlaG (beta-lactamase superfamily)
MAVMTTTLSRWGHACIRFDGPRGAFVIDPGAYSDLDHALDGVQAILVTHVHADHLDVARAAASGLPVWGPPEALTPLADAGVPSELLHPVADGDELEVAGFGVRAIGEWHAIVHPDIPRFRNVSYLVDGAVLHPGDAHPPAPGPLEMLLVPVSGPWAHTDAAIDWVRELAPRIAVPIHDAMASAIGQALVLSLLTRLTTADVRTPAPGEPVAFGG